MLLTDSPQTLCTSATFRRDAWEEELRCTAKAGGWLLWQKRMCCCLRESLQSCCTVGNLQAFLRAGKDLGNELVVGKGTD